MSTPLAPASGPTSTEIDPRGPRFTASVTLVVFAAVLLTAPSPIAWVLLGAQAAFFAIGAGRGVQYTPTAFLFKKVIRPRLAAPTHTEDARPPRFAQAVGLAFTVAALGSFAGGLDTLGLVFVAFALGAAFLNAVFGFCLGCEMYLLGQRLRRQGRSHRSPSSQGIAPGTTNTTTNESNKEEVIA